MFRFTIRELVLVTVFMRWEIEWQGMAEIRPTATSESHSGRVIAHHSAEPTRSADVCIEIHSGDPSMSSIYVTRLRREAVGLVAKLAMLLASDGGTGINI
jgi:hypothetical protein